MPATAMPGGILLRNRDLSVVWISEMVERCDHYAGDQRVSENRYADPELLKVRSLLQTGTIKRICIDQTGMGLPMVEQLAKEFGSKVEGVQFTAASKETLATNAKMPYGIPSSSAARFSHRSQFVSQPEENLERYGPRTIRRQGR